MWLFLPFGQQDTIYEHWPIYFRCLHPITFTQRPPGPVLRAAFFLGTIESLPGRKQASIPHLTADEQKSWPWTDSR
jgi:hypothetical protein